MDNLREKIGRLFVVGFYGTEISDEIKEIMRDYRVGNIILFSRNISNPAQLAKLTFDLQQEAKSLGYQEPLLITLDQENGIVKRISNGVSHLPGAMAQGATADAETSKEVYQMTAKELIAQGINWDLAPVADVNNNRLNPVIGVRSFGGNPQKVGQHVQNAVSGLQENGVMATLKHFPGHGDTQVDSHLALPVINKTTDDLAQMEFIPFEAGISAGVDCIMLAHINLPKLTEAELPASLSKNIVQLLREQLHFKQAIITDDLEMKAIANGIGTTNASILALKNGVNMIMISHSHAEQRKALAAFYDLACTDSQFRDQIDDSYELVSSITRKYTKPASEFDNAAFKAMVQRNQSIGTAIYQRSLAAIPQRVGTPIHRGESLALITFSEGQQSKVEDQKLTGNVLADLLREQGIKVIEYVVDQKQDLKTIEKSLKSIAIDTQVLVATMSLRGRDDLPARLIRHICRNGYQVTDLALRNPYDRYFIGEKIPFISTFEPTPEALLPVVGYLLGNHSAVGSFPVAIE